MPSRVVVHSLETSNSLDHLTTLYTSHVHTQYDSSSAAPRTNSLSLVWKYNHPRKNSDIMCWRTLAVSL